MLERCIEALLKAVQGEADIETLYLLAEAFYSVFKQAWDSLEGAALQASIVLLLDCSSVMSEFIVTSFLQPGAAPSASPPSGSPGDSKKAGTPATAQPQVVSPSDDVPHTVASV